MAGIEPEARKILTNQNALFNRRHFLFLVSFLALALLLKSNQALAWYAPGETLNPSCAPTTPGCDVYPAVSVTSTMSAGQMVYWDGGKWAPAVAVSVTSAGLTVSGDATTTGNFSTNNLTFGTASGASLTSTNAYFTNLSASNFNLSSFSVASATTTNLAITGNLNVTLATFSGLSASDLSDNASLAKLAGGQTFTGANIFSGTTTLATTTISSSTITQANITNLSVGNSLSLPANSVTDAMVVDTITASNYLSLVGGTLTGGFIFTTSSGSSVSTTNILSSNVTSTNHYNSGLLVVAGNSTLATTTIASSTITFLNVASETSTNLTVSGSLSLPNNSITDAVVADTITASNYLPLVGGTLTGGVTFTTGTITSITSTNFYVSGQMSAGGVFFAATGTAAAPGIAFNYAGDNDDGFYVPALDTMGVVTGGVERMRFESNGGVTFFGTSTLPTTTIYQLTASNVTSTNHYNSGQLVVVGNSILATTTISSSTITFLNATTLNATNDIFGNATSTNHYNSGLFVVAGNSTLATTTISSSTITYLNATNVTSSNATIGTLTITTSTITYLNATNVTSTLVSTTNLFVPGTASIGTLNLTTSTVTYLNATNATTTNFNVGFITQTSSVSTGNAFNMTLNSLTTGSGLSLTANGPALNSTNGLLYVANLGTSTGGLLASFVASTTASSGLYIRNNGFVGIGTSSPSTLLQVGATTTADANQVTIMDNNGTCTLNPGSGAAWSCTSDRNLKHDIASLSGGLDAVQKLKPSTFKMNVDNSPGVGFIAQEVQEVLPGLVNALPNGTLTVAEGGMMPYVVEAIQEQQAEIISLQALNQLSTTGALTFDGHLTLGKDTVGEAMVNSGATSAAVSFAEPYTEKPIITITPEAQVQGSYWVSNVGANGFEITISQSQSSDVLFSWHAFAAKGQAFPVAQPAPQPTPPASQSDTVPTVNASTTPTSTDTTADTSSTPN